MQYMLMIYGDEQLWVQMPEAQKGKIMQEYREFTEGIVKSGHFRTGARRPFGAVQADAAGHAVVDGEGGDDFPIVPQVAPGSTHRARRQL